MHPIVRFVLLVGTGLSTVSCVNYGLHQTGRTLGKQGVAIQGNYNLGMAQANQFYGKAEPEGPIHILEGGVMVGAGEQADLGLRINNMGHFTFQGKGQYLGHKESLGAGSLMAEVGFNGLAMLSIGWNYHTAVSMPFSIHPLPMLAIGLAPRYFMLHINHYDTFDSFLNDDYRQLYGFTAGLFVGREFRMSLEITQMQRTRQVLWDSQPLLSLGFSIQVR